MTIQDNDAALQRHNGVHAPTTQAKQSFVSLAPQQWQMAVNLADADVIPKDFRRKPANIFVALEMAHRLDIGPLEAMQNLYVVHGTPSMSAKFLIALANRSRRFIGGLRFDVEGDGEEMSVTCKATDRETGHELSVTATYQQAKTARWIYGKAEQGKPAPIKPLWKHSQEQMLSYRAATFFVRRYCPEVSLGMMTKEEAEEAPREVAVEPSGVLDAMNAEIAAVDEPKAEAPKEVVLELVTEETVEQMVEAFKPLGLDRAALEADFGPLDAMTEETRQRALAQFRAMKADLEEQAEDAPKEPRDALFEEPTQEYDPDAGGPV